MKQTHKLKALSNVAETVAAASSLTAAARYLGVNRSTLHRWIRAGKVAVPAAARPTKRTGLPRGAAGPGQTPEGWARAVRRAYTLTGTEQQLLVSATDALTIARDHAARAETRLAAMGRYQALVRQLNLEQEGSERGEVETADTTSAGRWPRAVS